MEQYPSKSSEQKLQEVYFDNLRDNQIGGQTDGISTEVAADLGYQTYEQTKDIIDNNDNKNRPAYAPPNPLEGRYYYESLPAMTKDKQVKQQDTNIRNAKIAKMALRRAQQRKRQV